MKPENCPFRKVDYQRSLGNPKPLTYIRCVASDSQKGAILGFTEEEAMAEACSKCPIPAALEGAPAQAVPKALFTAGQRYPKSVLWRCTVCKAVQLGGHDELRDCHA